MPKVVVSDAVNAEAVELLRKAGFAVVFNDKLKPEELAAEMADGEDGGVVGGGGGHGIRAALLRREPGGRKRFPGAGVLAFPRLRVQ